MHNPPSLPHVWCIVSGMNVGVENEDLAEKIQDTSECMRESQSLVHKRQMEKLHVRWNSDAGIPEGPPVSLQYMSRCAVTTACLNRSCSTGCDLFPEAT